MANMKFGYVQLDSALLHKISQWYGVRFQSYNLKINYKFKIVQLNWILQVGHFINSSQHKGGVLFVLNKYISPLRVM